MAVFLNLCVKISTVLLLHDLAGEAELACFYSPGSQGLAFPACPLPKYILKLKSDLGL